ncbi:hypothetical protein HELRODRAFT_176678 [Helobdella robusta]|uniref:C2H2-type domain-containing protein n=1 Tax=Helobdella robusta TaxID=6412 RepID=T1FAS3_HELRO|nr:hypothetical protein HELRODRAFT_176678 [Helobdella robusta]ESN99516.1 hypothetical protein HELRODRAFT_176678 [Helobdella robusta]
MNVLYYQGFPCLPTNTTPTIFVGGMFNNVYEGNINIVDNNSNKFVTTTSTGNNYPLPTLLTIPPTTSSIFPILQQQEQKMENNNCTSKHVFKNNFIHENINKSLDFNQTSNNNIAGINCNDKNDANVCSYVIYQPSKLLCNQQQFLTEDINKSFDQHLQLHQRQQKQHIRCYVCNLSLNSQLQASQHFSGKSHHRKVRKMRYEGEKLKRTRDNEGKQIDLRLDNVKKLCDIDISISSNANCISNSSSNITSSNGSGGCRISSSFGSISNNFGSVSNSYIESNNIFTENNNSCQNIDREFNQNLNNDSETDNTNDVNSKNNNNNINGNDNNNINEISNTTTNINNTDADITTSNTDNNNIKHVINDISDDIFNYSNTQKRDNKCIVKPDSRINGNNKTDHEEFIDGSDCAGMKSEINFNSKMSTKTLVDKYAKVKEGRKGYANQIQVAILPADSS